MNFLKNKSKTIRIAKIVVLLAVFAFSSIGIYYWFSAPKTVHATGASIIEFAHQYRLSDTSDYSLTFTQDAAVGDVMVIFVENNSPGTHAVISGNADSLGNTYAEQNYVNRITCLTAPVTHAGKPKIIFSAYGSDAGASGWIVRGLSSATYHKTGSNSGSGGTLTISLTTTVTSSLFMAYSNEAAVVFTSFNADALGTQDNSDTGHTDAHGHKLDVPAGSYAPGSISTGNFYDTVMAIYLPNTLPNTAPTIGTGPADGSPGSSATTPTNAGSNVAFSATATDGESDNYYLAVCKTDAITAVNSGPPTCATSKTWCVSGSTASGSSASCNYKTSAGDSESNDWFAFVCDNNAASACSASSQGSSDSGSPFIVNHAPAFSTATVSTNPIANGAVQTFSTTSSDADTSPTVTLYACKSNDFTGSACGSRGEWCHTTSPGASNASCTYTIQSSDGYGSKNYFGYIVDNHGFSSISNPISGTFVIPIYGSQSGNGLTFKGNIKMKGNLTIAAWACGNTLTDSRDSQSYATVKIGTQCWMAANMNVGAMVDVAQDQADNGTIEKYCYDNSTGNCTTYGGLYQWPEALQYNNGVTLTSGSPAGGNIRGICPIGWHIPNDTEFTTLSTYLGGDTVSGGHLKEAGTAHWTTPNTGADNSSGFTGLTTGRRNTSGGTDKLGEYGIYWSTLPQGATAAYELLLRYNTATYLLNNDDRSLGGAVRCLKD